MDKNLKDKLMFVYSFNMVFIFGVVLAFIVIDAMLLGGVGSIVAVVVFLIASAYAIFKLHLLDVNKICKICNFNNLEYV